MSKYCWYCANIGKCKYASGKIIRCKRFNPYLSVEEFCTEIGISVRTFYRRSLSELQKCARAKGIVIVKDYYDGKKQHEWVIYKVKM